MTVYTYTVNGTAASGQTWETSGTVDFPPGDFPLAVDAAMRETFMKLTKGEAVFGFPGVGCHGPYRVIKFTLEVKAN